MAAVGKEAYVRPIKDLSVTAKRVTEQVRGRLVHHYTETFKKGSSKTVAVLVDGESLRSVLVLEAWSAADQAHMKQALLPHAGKVVCLTAFKAQSRGRSLVFFDRDLRVAFDKSTKVTVGTGEYPMTLPLLPQVKDAMLCANSCMISIEVVLLEDPVTKDVTLQDGGKKQVCNVKVGSGDSSLNAAFWHPLSEQMQSASKNGVYRLDWVMLIPEGAGKFKLTTGAGSEVSQSFGEAATAARSNLSENTTSLSTVYGRTREEKLKQPFSAGSLTTLHHIMHLNPSTGVYSGKSMMIPAVFVKDIRSMNVDEPENLWYLGCTNCKKQLSDSQCEVHGPNQGQKVYGVQVLFADPTRTLEVAVWEDALKSMQFCLNDVPSDLDEDGQLQTLQAGLMTEKLCLRVEFGVNKAGSGMYYDVFDISPQVTEEGAAGAFKSLDADVFFACPGIVPACCQSIQMNEHQQLQIATGDKRHTVDSVHLLCQVLQKPNVRVMPDMDGLEIALPVSCGFCGQLVRLVAAGVPDSVQDFMMMQQKNWITALCQTRWSDGSFLVAQFKSEENDARLKTLQKLCKFECKEVLAKVNASKSLPESKSKMEEIEGLLAEQRAAKRLKMVKTLDGTEL